MTTDEYRSFCEARASGQSVRRRPESVRPHDPVLAKRLALELTAAEATDDQARAALLRTAIENTQ
jgi:hypothetical protein